MSSDNVIIIEEDTNSNEGSAEARQLEKKSSNNNNDTSAMVNQKQQDKQSTADSKTTPTKGNQADDDDSIDSQIIIHGENQRPRYRIWTCPYVNCGLHFATRDLLKKHKLTHDGEKIAEAPPASGVTTPTAASTPVTTVPAVSASSAVPATPVTPSTSSGSSPASRNRPPYRSARRDGRRRNSATPPITGPGPYQCDYLDCRKSYSMKVNIVRHKRLVHGGDLPLPCADETCPWRFNTSAHRQEHILERHPGLLKEEDLKELPPPPPPPVRRSTAKKSMQSDISADASLTSYRLPRNCKANSAFMDSDWLNDGDELDYLLCEDNEVERKPAKTAEEPVLRYACQYPGCKKSFALETLLENHVKTHLSDSVHRCRYPGCGQKFNQIYELRLHEKRHQKVAWCAETQSWIVNATLITTSDARPKAKPATVGSASITDEDSQPKLPKGMPGAKRLEDNKYICRVNRCFKVFRSESHYIQHTRSHKETQVIPCSWEGCEVILRSKEELMQHLYVHGSNEKDFKRKSADEIDVIRNGDSKANGDGKQDEDGDDEVLPYLETTSEFKMFIAKERENLKRKRELEKDVSSKKVDGDQSEEANHSDSNHNMHKPETPVVVKATARKSFQQPAYEKQSCILGPFRRISMCSSTSEETPNMNSKPPSIGEASSASKPVGSDPPQSTVGDQADLAPIESNEDSMPKEPQSEEVATKEPEYPVQVNGDLQESTLLEVDAEPAVENEATGVLEEFLTQEAAEETAVMEVDETCNPEPSPPEADTLVPTATTTTTTAAAAEASPPILATAELPAPPTLTDSKGEVVSASVDEAADLPCESGPETLAKLAQSAVEAHSKPAEVEKEKEIEMFDEFRDILTEHPLDLDDIELLDEENLDPAATASQGISSEVLQSDLPQRQFSNVISNDLYEIMDDPGSNQIYICKANECGSFFRGANAKANFEAHFHEIHGREMNFSFDI